MARSKCGSTGTCASQRLWRGGLGLFQPRSLSNEIAVSTGDGVVWRGGDNRVLLLDEGISNDVRVKPSGGGMTSRVLGIERVKREHLFGDLGAGSRCYE